MTAEQLGAVAGVALSLAFSYIPGLRDRFATLDQVHKSMWMALLLLAVAVIAFGLSCASVIVSVECSQAGAIGLVNVYIAALVANQGAFLISPKVAAK